MPKPSPADVVTPLLGGPAGHHRGPIAARWTALSAAVSLGVLGIVCLLGVLKVGSCFSSGFELPSASYRVCASPVANAVLGFSFPDAPGRSLGDSARFAPATWWFMRFAESVTASDASGVIAFMMVINVLAFAAFGIALIMLTTNRAWVLVAFVSPIVFFSIGQSLDPVGVACALWAVVLLRPVGHSPRNVVAAGVLLACAVMVNPLAIVFAAGLLVHLFSARRGDDALVSGGVGVIAVGVLTLLDGRIVGRLQAWYADAVDRGTVLSLLAYQPGFGQRALVNASLVVFTLVVVVVCLAARSWAKKAERPVPLAALLTVLMGVALLLLPAAPIVNALWMLPVAALAVQRLWPHVCWMLAEAALFVAVNLGDAGTLQSSKGLSPAWVAIFTILRVAAVLVVVYYASVKLAQSNAASGRGTAAGQTTVTGSGAAGTDTSADTYTLVESGAARSAVVVSGPRDEDMGMSPPTRLRPHPTTSPPRATAQPTPPPAASAPSAQARQTPDT